jgi:hypothetical protein
MALLKLVGIIVVVCACVIVAIVMTDHITPHVGDVYADPLMNMELDLENPFDSVLIAEAKFTVIEIKNDYCKYEGIKQHCVMYVDDNGLHRAYEIMRDTSSTKCTDLDRLYTKVPKTHKIKVVTTMTLCD